MSKEKKKPKQNKPREVQSGQPSAAVEAKNQPNNVKKEAMGPNARQD